MLSIDNKQSQNNTYYCHITILSIKKSNKLKLPPTVYLNFCLQKQQLLINQTKSMIPSLFPQGQNSTIFLNHCSMQFKISLSSQNLEYHLFLLLHNQDKVLVLGQQIIDCQIYVQLFQEEKKSIFKQSIQLSKNFFIQYQIFIHSSQSKLLKIIRQYNFQSPLRNAFRKSSKKQLSPESQSRIDQTEKLINYLKKTKIKKIKYYKQQNKKQFCSNKFLQNKIQVQYKKIQTQNHSKDKKYDWSQFIIMSVIIFIMIYLIIYLMSPLKKI